ncbi:MAG TPA: DUF177 domain-containing protein [Bryobacteraceae bacterium]|nr:DUF177 domain-containing protein [Bryobacteraceae bacterium]
MVFFNVRELELRKVPFEEEFPPGEIDFDPEFLRQVGTIRARGVAELLNNTLGEIRVRGTVSVDLEVACDRCLEPVRMPLDRDFDLFYRPAPTDDLPHDLAIDAGESEIGFYEGLGIDSKEILREFILLSMPMQQICDESCRGICSRCGENLNTGSCDCVVEAVNDRWSALRDWKTAPERS